MNFMAIWSRGRLVPRKNKGSNVAFKELVQRTKAAATPRLNRFARRAVQQELSGKEHWRSGAPPPPLISAVRSGQRGTHGPLPVQAVGGMLTGY